MGKRNERKLSLNKVTVRALNTGELGRVAAANAGSIFPQPTICLVGPCAPSNGAECSFTIPTFCDGFKAP
jgi:hypothetical protein